MNLLCYTQVSHLRILHGQQPLWTLAVAQCGLPQVLLHIQLQHDVPNQSVPVFHTTELLHLLPVHGFKLGVEGRLDAMNHILRSGVKYKWNS